MSTLRNKVTLVGYVGNAPEIKNFDNGGKVVKLTLATNESYKNKQGERVENTQWHNIVVWGSLAGIVEKHVTKGQEIAIEGKLVYRSYDGKDGEKRYITEIEAGDVLFLGKKS